MICPAYCIRQMHVKHSHFVFAYVWIIKITYLSVVMGYRNRFVISLLWTNVYDSLHLLNCTKNRVYIFRNCGLWVSPLRWWLKIIDLICANLPIFGILLLPLSFHNNNVTACVRVTKSWNRCTLSHVDLVCAIDVIHCHWQT